MNNNLSISNNKTDKNIKPLIIDQKSLRSAKNIMTNGTGYIYSADIENQTVIINGKEVLIRSAYLNEGFLRSGRFPLHMIRFPEPTELKASDGNLYKFSTDYSNSYNYGNNITLNPDGIVIEGYIVDSPINIMGTKVPVTFCHFEGQYDSFKDYNNIYPKYMMGFPMPDGNKLTFSKARYYTSSTSTPSLYSDAICGKFLNQNITNATAEFSYNGNKMFLDKITFMNPISLTNYDGRPMLFSSVIYKNEPRRVSEGNVKSVSMTFAGKKADLISCEYKVIDGSGTYKISFDNTCDLIGQDGKTYSFASPVYLDKHGKVTSGTVVNSEIQLSGQKAWFSSANLSYDNMKPKWSGLYLQYQTQLRTKGNDTYDFSSSEGIILDKDNEVIEGKINDAVLLIQGKYYKTITADYIYENGKSNLTDIKLVRPVSLKTEDGTYNKIIKIHTLNDDGTVTGKGTEPKEKTGFYWNIGPVQINNHGSYSTLGINLLSLASGALESDSDYVATKMPAAMKNKIFDTFEGYNTETMYTPLLFDLPDGLECSGASHGELLKFLGGIFSVYTRGYSMEKPDDTFVHDDGSYSYGDGGYSGYGGLNGYEIFSHQRTTFTEKAIKYNIPLLGIGKTLMEAERSRIDIFLNSFYEKLIYRATIDLDLKETKYFYYSGPTIENSYKDSFNVNYDRDTINVIAGISYKYLFDHGYDNHYGFDYDMKIFDNAWLNISAGIGYRYRQYSKIDNCTIDSRKNSLFCFLQAEIVNVNFNLPIILGKK